MKTLEWLESLRPAIPMSAEVPCKVMSKAELRRHIEQGGVLVNGERVSLQEEIDFQVHSLVFFPKSARRTTLV